MRYSELRLLRWSQVDLKVCTLTVGQSKTESGTGRLLPLNDRAVAILGFWASLFPLRELSHFVFPSERYGASGDGATVVYASDPTKPIGRWKEAWESAKIRACVSCRFHDLRLYSSPLAKNGLALLCRIDPPDHRLTEDRAGS